MYTQDFPYLWVSPAICHLYCPLGCEMSGPSKCTHRTRTSDLLTYRSMTLSLGRGGITPELLKRSEAKVPRRNKNYQILSPWGRITVGNSVAPSSQKTHHRHLPSTWLPTTTSSSENPEREAETPRRWGCLRSRPLSRTRDHASSDKKGCV